MVNVYKYLKGLNTMGIGQCGKFMLILFFVCVMLNFVCVIVGTLLNLTALRPRALPKDRENAPLRNLRLIYLSSQLFEY